MRNSFLNKSSESSNYQSSTSLRQRNAESPARQKMEMISEKWNSIQNNVERNKAIIKNKFDENIKQIEDQITIQKPQTDNQFRVLKDNALSIQETIEKQTCQRENHNQESQQELKKINSDLQDQLDRENNLQKQTEARTIRYLEDVYNELQSLVLKNQKQFDEDKNQKTKEVYYQIGDLMELILTEEERRIESIQFFSDNLEKESKKFLGMLQIQKKSREDTQKRMLQNIEELTKNINKQQKLEQREREQSHENLEELLNETCLKIDKEFSY